MKNVLPFNHNPKMKSYPFYSDYLGVLEAYGINVMPILYRYYFTLYYTPKIHQIGFRNFNKLQKLFDIEYFSLDNIKPLDFMKNKLNNNQYVEIVLNRKHFSSSKNDFFHNFLIYGYDDEKESFFGCGFFKNDKGFMNYDKFDLSYSDFLNSLPKNGEKTAFENNIMNNHVFSLPNKLKIKNCNKKYIICQILAYYLAMPPIFFNISVYRRYIYVLKKHTNQKLDLRNFVTLYEHKQIIYSYLCDNLELSQLTKKYKTNVLNKMYVALLLAIQFNLTREVKILNKIIDLFSYLYKKERNILNKVVLVLLNRK